jgi:hypothetical protein
MNKIAASIAQIAAEVIPSERLRTAPIDLPANLSAALDAWIADQPEPKPSQSDVICVALTEHLKAKGHLK